MFCTKRIKHVTDRIWLDIIINFSRFSVQDKIDVLNEKVERDTFDKPDCVDFENNISKALTKKRKYFDSDLTLLLLIELF